MASYMLRPAPAPNLNPTKNFSLRTQIVLLCCSVCDARNVVSGVAWSSDDRRSFSVRLHGVRIRHGVVVSRKPISKAKTYNTYRATSGILQRCFFCVTDRRTAYRPWSKPAPTGFDLQPNSHTQPWSAVDGGQLCNPCK